MSFYDDIDFLTRMRILEDKGYTVILNVPYEILDTDTCANRSTDADIDTNIDKEIVIDNYANKGRDFDGYRRY